MFCKYCGHELADDSAFCSNCGKPVNEETSAPEKPKKKTMTVKESIFNKKSLVYIVLAILCLVPLAYAEYRRIIQGHFDVTYWLLATPTILAVYLVYKVIGAPVIEEEKNKQARAYDETGITPYKGVDPHLFTLRCEMLSLCCFIVAIPIFIISGVINML